ncbi:hypothetical protein QTP88_003009 [Uroleucon formosanum]
MDQPEQQDDRPSPRKANPKGKSMGFKFTKRGRNSALMENEIQAWRREYIRDIRKYREEGRPIYYIDETWVNAGDNLSTGAANPTGKGKRLIMCHIGSEDGFVPDSLLCFESKKNTDDYHDEMNGDSFRDWLEGVLPRLKENAVIIVDNAPYHSVKLEKCPTTNWRKADIVEWLESKGEVVDKRVAKVDAAMWKNFISHTIKEENKFWALDDTIDDLTAEQDSIIMTIGNSDTEDDDFDLLSD